MPPVADRLVAHLDTALVQEVFNIPERKREPDVQHHRQADDLRARLEPLEGAGLGHRRRLVGPLPRLKPGLSDKTSRAKAEKHSLDKPRI
jgi:hypothetical protein